MQLLEIELTTATYTHLWGKEPLPLAYTAPIGKNLLSAIFYDIYFRADILPKAKIKAFFIMLQGPALDNRPSNIGISSTIMNSDQVRYSIKKKWMKWDKT